MLLSDYLGDGKSAIVELSKRLNLGQEILDCTNVYALEPEELEALFSNIRPEWRKTQELENFIDMETIDDELFAQIAHYLELPPPPSVPIQNNPISKLLLLNGLGITILAIILLLLSIPYLTKSRIQAKTLTIGTLEQPENQKDLEDYLQEKLVPANYLDCLRGDKVKIIIDGDKTLPYQEAQNRIEAKKWDIAFTLSPVNSVFAKDNGYTFAALMFPESPGYQAGLFVKADSLIRYLDDIKPTTLIALGSLTSASSFYMPAYDLYGKIATVKIGNRGHEIVKMVKKGQVDIGAAAIGDAVRNNDPELRIIHYSRKIPGSGVYLSPKLSTLDQTAIKKVMLDAPIAIKNKSNYGIGQEPDYTYLRGLIKKVNEILICSDFSKNPVEFFCPPGFTPILIKGKINGSSSTSNGYVLTVENSDRLIYHISLTPELLKDAIGSSDLKAIQDKTIEVKIPIKPVQIKDGTFSIKITQSSQIKFLR